MGAAVDGMCWKTTMTPSSATTGAGRGRPGHGADPSRAAGLAVQDLSPAMASAG